MYAVIVHYKDGESINIKLSCDEVDSFKEYLKEGKGVWEAKMNTFFWTDVSTLRCVSGMPVPEGDHKPEEEKADG